MNNTEDIITTDSGTLPEEAPSFQKAPEAMFSKQKNIETTLQDKPDKVYQLNEGESKLVRQLPPNAADDVVSVFDVACYIMSKVKQCTTMKLQKLLYYCQAWYLVWNERPLFRENIEAWANGPVIRELYNFHKGLFTITESMMNLGNPNRLSKDQMDDVDSVLKAYAPQSSQWLIEQTHLEKPWQDARRGLSPNERGHVVITHAAMAEYYSSLYGQE